MQGGEPGLGKWLGVGAQAKVKIKAEVKVMVTMPVSLTGYVRQLFYITFT